MNICENCTAKGSGEACEKRRKMGTCEFSESWVFELFAQEKAEEIDELKNEHAGEIAELAERHTEETDTLKAALRETTDMLAEAHGPELENDHGGDDSCSYCDRIAENEELLK